LRPFDAETILESVRKTGRLVAAEQAWKSLSFSAEVVATVAENALDRLHCAPRRVCLPDCPTPTSPALAAQYYPRAVHLAATIRQMMGRGDGLSAAEAKVSTPLDIPDKSFTGPF
jgi:pyruvate dehydrogenase E1 component beta subunit